MTPTLAAPLAPFVDGLPVPQRLIAARQNGQLSVPIRAGAHRFHRDLPESAIWGYDGTVPGPAIEAERGQRERELGLPEGPPFEVPLLIQDRNFGLDESGRLTGQLVHKTDPEVMEAFSPFTVVNGKVWPLLQVHAATYRFRVLNGSNARTYRLVLLRDGEPELHRIAHIGTDQGLLRTPARVPPDGLVLASAERADLLIDFSDLEPGSELTLLNTAAAPFDGTAFPAADADNAADPGRMLPYPQVMRFRVVPGPVTRRTITGELATDYRSPAPDALAGAPRRTIALVERELEGAPNMLTMRELVTADDDHAGPVVTVTDGERTTRYRAAAAHFEDATTFFPVLDRYEVWQLITASRTSPSPLPSRSNATLTTSSTTPLTTTNVASRTPSASIPARSSRSWSVLLPTAAATCTTATSSNTRTAT